MRSSPSEEPPPRRSEQFRPKQGATVLLSYVARFGPQPLQRGSSSTTEPEELAKILAIPSVFYIQVNRDLRGWGQRLRVGRAGPTQPGWLGPPDNLNHGPKPSLARHTISSLHAACPVRPARFRSSRSPPPQPDP